MTWCDELISYICRFEPRFASRISPANERTVGQLEFMIGRRLVGVHREFLFSMGGCDGGLFFADGLNTTAQEILEESRLILEEYGSGFFEKFSVFATSPSTEGIAIVLRGEMAKELVFLQRDCAHEGWTPLAESLPNYAFGCAFYREMRSHSRHAWFLRMHHSLYSQATLSLVHDGFVTEPFSDRLTWYARRDKTLVAIVHEVSTDLLSAHLIGGRKTAYLLADKLAREFDIDPPITVELAG